MDLMDLFDNKKENKEKGSNISKRIEKDIKKRKNSKIKGRGITKNLKINKEKKEDNKNDINNNEDNYMDLDQKYKYNEI